MSDGPTADDVFRAHGLTGEGLLGLARKIATDELRRRGADVGDRYEDLVSFLCVEAMKAALSYDDSRQHRSYGRDGGRPFESYLCDIMVRRITDWYRSKHEAFADRRHAGNAKTLVLFSDMNEVVDRA